MHNDNNNYNINYSNNLKIINNNDMHNDNNNYKNNYSYNQK